MRHSVKSLIAGALLLALFLLPVEFNTLSARGGHGGGGGGGGGHGGGHGGGWAGGGHHGDWGGGRGWDGHHGDWNGGHSGGHYYGGYGGYGGYGAAALGVGYGLGVLSAPAYYEGSASPYYDSTYPYSNYYYDNDSGVYYNVR